MIEAFMKTEIKSKWTMGLTAVLLLVPFGAFAATDDLSTTLSKGMFEEEANHNPGAAIQVYESLIDRFDADRKLAATAVFRLGECYRKQGSTNEATAQYQRILSEFADQAPLVALSRQNLAASGMAQAALAPVERVAEYNETCSLLESQRKKLKDLLVQFTPGSAFVKAAHTEIDATLEHKDQLEASYPGLIAASPDGRGGENSATVLDVGEISRVQAIIKNSPDLINAPDQSGQTLLQTYAGRGNLAVVKLLLDSGAAANGIKQPDLSPLHFAAGNGHKSVVDLLLSKGAKADVKTEAGVTPLHLAVLKGYELVAKDLIEAGAPVSAKVILGSSRTADSLTYEFHVGQTPLHVACLKGYPGLVDLLIAKGADVNAEDAKGATPLTVATQGNDEDMVKTLLAAHADANAGAYSALNAAASQGNVTVLDLLLSHGANPNVNHTLEQAVVFKHPKAVKKLIEFKADPNVKNANGLPLIFGALSDPPTLLALLEGGADPNQQRDGGASALRDVASSNGDYDQALEMLLTHGADPNAADPAQGFTALHLAAMSRKTGAMSLLLKHGAKVNAQAKDGRSPLHFAVMNSNQEVAAVLLDSGADPNLRDNNGTTPLDIAKQQPGAVPFAPPPGGRGAPSLSLPTAPTKPVNIADLLREHGGTDDLPRFDRIEVRRFPKYIATVFSRSTNDLSRFSLLELLAVHYGFVSAVNYPRPGQIPTYDGRSRTIQGSLGFPNLDRIEIRRPKPDGKAWTRISVSVRSILESGDCSRDSWLQWGDQVEIPEADRPLFEQWNGFSEAALTNVQNCLRRQVEFTVKGETNNLTLQPGWPLARNFSGANSEFRYAPPQFYLVPALENSGLLRTSSDLSRVKVTRHNSNTGENWDRTFDCSGTKPYPDLWLRDGDVIEVPDKP
jgi:ankyrin repeat protein